MKRIKLELQMGYVNGSKKKANEAANKTGRNISFLRFSQIRFFAFFSIKICAKDFNYAFRNNLVVVCLNKSVSVQLAGKLLL